MDIAVSPKTVRRRGRPQARAALLCSDLTKEHSTTSGACGYCADCTRGAVHLFYCAVSRQGSVTEEQRSRRAVFGETLRAEGLLPWVFVAPRFQIAEGYARSSLRDLSQNSSQQQYL
jgi:hypothetical protein